MATTHTNKSERAAKAKSMAKGGATGAIELLKKDHREVQGMFKTFQSEKDDDEQASLAEQICTALKIHTQIEEEIFYPAAREEIDNPRLVEQSMVEHQGAKELIQQIEQMEPGEELFEARMQVLCEQIDHHIEEEETQLFPACQKAGMDLDRLGRELADRKQQLMGRMKDGGSRGH